MVNTPQPYYRSDSYRELAERIASGAGYDSLNITVNVDQILKNRNNEVPQQVHEAIEQNANFVLFSDKDHYILIIPCKLAVACYVNGMQQTWEAMKDIHQFQNRVKISFAVYDRFYQLDRPIESGRNGDAALPLHTDRENMRDRETGA
jgi:uncharacterized protein (DUF302 family)